MAFAVSGATAVRADAQQNAYVVTKLVSDIAAPGQEFDPVLQNAWGVAFTPGGSPFWVSDNNTGCSTLYDGTGVKQGLQVSIPLPGNVVPSTDCQHVNPPPAPAPSLTPAAPTGMVWNPSSSFLVPGTTMAASFIWATEDGTISAWTGGLTPNPDNARLAVDNSTNPTAALGAVYKGLVFGVNVNGVFLFATNFRDGRIDVFGPALAANSVNGCPAAPGSTSGCYVPADTDGDFTDPNIPSGYAPFGIQNIDGSLFVTYAKQNPQKHDDVAGEGHGFVDVFDTNGHLLQSFAARRTLNSPWGVARASFDFAPFSGDILVGNFGDGRINVFDSRGRFLDQLKDLAGKPLTINGLWTLTLGGGKNSSSDTLYFTAGPNMEMDGLFGTITPATENE